MRINISNKTTSLIAVVILIVTCLSFPMAKSIPILNRRWLFQFIGWGLPVIVCSKVFVEKRCLYLLLYFLCVGINFLVGDSYFKSVQIIIEEISCLFIPMVLAYIIFRYNNELLLRWLLICCALLFVYITAATFAIDMLTPGIVRIATSMQFGGDDTLIRMLERIGASNYYLPHALPVLAPALIAGIRTKQFSLSKRLIFGVLYVLTLVLTYLGRGATAILLIVGISIISFLLSGKTLNNDILKIGLLFLLISPLINTDFELKVLDMLANSMDSENALQSKIRDTRNTIIYGEASGDIEERTDLYKQSSFLGINNIIFGSNDNTGGHSGILDRFATLGIVGFIPYMLFLVGQLKFPVRYLSRRLRSFYLCGVIAAIAMLFLKSMSNWEMWFILLCILPCTLRYIDVSSQTTEV